MITREILRYHGWEQGRAIGLAKVAAAALADADAELDDTNLGDMRVVVSDHLRFAFAGNIGNVLVGQLLRF